MALSYAGITLPLSTPLHQQWLDAIHPQDTFVDFERWNFEGYDLQRLPTPPLPRMPKPRVGVLWWPTGACRVATFYAVVTTAIADQIREVVTAQRVPQQLVMNDGRTGKQIVADMSMLPFRPLNQLGRAASDAWIMTLVDQRFWWGPFKFGSVPTPPASWSDLFGQLGQILGVVIDVDAIDPAYQFPSDKWVGYYRPTATVLDAAAAQINQRVVVELDGTVKTVNWTTAKGLSESYRLAGGYKVLSGGIVENADVALYVPSSVSVLFNPNATGNVAPYVVNEPLLSLPGVSGVYEDPVGVTDATGVFYADFTFVGSGTAVTDCAALALVTATDWYGWRATDPDVVFAGVEPWTPTGWEDYVEWTYQVRQGEEGDTPYASTMVRRGPWDAYPSGTYQKPGVGTGGGGGDNTFLALLFAKDYTLAPFITYSWVRVKDTAGAGGTHQITYDFSDTTSPRCGGPDCTPAYHVRNLDLPVWHGTFTPTPCCDPPASPPAMPITPPPLSVVRMRKSPFGNWMLFGEHPWEDLFRRTGTSDADGEIAFLRYWDQNTQAWADGQEVRLVFGA